LQPGEQIAMWIPSYLANFSGTQVGGFVHIQSDVDVFSFLMFGDFAGSFLSAVPTR
jgi:hypothetical protein